MSASTATPSLLKQEWSLPRNSSGLQDQWSKKKDCRSLSKSVWSRGWKQAWRGGSTKLQRYIYKVYKTPALIALGESSRCPEFNTGNQHNLLREKRVTPLWLIAAKTLLVQKALLSSTTAKQVEESCIASGNKKTPSTWRETVWCKNPISGRVTTQTAAVLRQSARDKSPCRCILWGDVPLLLHRQTTLPQASVSNHKREDTQLWTQYKSPCRT